MPLVANPGQAATNLVGEALAELARPLPHGFVADHDAARGQQLLHHAQPEWKAEIQPHGMADNLGWKPMALVAGASGGRHSTRLSAPVSQRNPEGHVKLTVPSRSRLRRTGKAACSTALAPIFTIPTARYWSLSI